MIAMSNLEAFAQAVGRDVKVLNQKPEPRLTLTGNTLGIVGGNNVTLPLPENVGHEIHGTGSPEGRITAEIGTTYVDVNMTNGALKWIKQSGTGNTGWKVIHGDTGWLTVFKKDEQYNKNTLKLRRVNNIVNVLFYNDNPEDDSIYFSKESKKENLATVRIASGFKPETDLLFTAFNNFDDIEDTWILSIGACRFNIVNNVLTVDLALVNSYNAIGSGINKLNFTYSTYEDWPTTLP